MPGVEDNKSDLAVPVVEWLPGPDRMVPRLDGRNMASWYKMGLYNALLKFRPKVCVEIGTRAGGTARIFSRYFGEHCRDGRLVTCDIREWREIKLFGVRPIVVWPHGEQEIVEVLRDEAGLGEGWREKVGDSVRLNAGLIGDALGEKADLIYIDGDHSWVGVEKDVDIARRVCKLGGIAIFDDIDNRNAKCSTYWREMLVPDAEEEYEFETETYEFNDWPVFVGMGVMRL